jgi:hypothetical protein
MLRGGIVTRAEAAVARSFAWLAWSKDHGGLMRGFELFKIRYETETVSRLVLPSADRESR